MPVVIILFLIFIVLIVHIAYLSLRNRALEKKNRAESDHDADDRRDN